MKNILHCWSKKKMLTRERFEFAPSHSGFRSCRSTCMLSCRVTVRTLSVSILFQNHHQRTWRHEKNILVIYHTWERVYYLISKHREKRGDSRVSKPTSGGVWKSDNKRRSSVCYSFSNKSVFKEKFEVKVGQIYGRYLPHFLPTSR